MARFFGIQILYAADIAQRLHPDPNLDQPTPYSLASLCMRATGDVQELCTCCVNSETPGPADRMEWRVKRLKELRARAKQEKTTEN
jgi:hypothetical protein